MAKKYNKETKLAEVLSSPAASEVISKYKLPCLHCAMAEYEAGVLSLGQAAGMYGTDLDGLLKELNELE